MFGKNPSFLWTLIIVAAVLVASPAKAEPWKSLFDGKKLGRWEVATRFDFINHGEVTVKDGNLVLGKGRPGTAIRWTGDFPTMDYEISLEATRVDGDDFFCGMTFPVNDAALSLILGGWGGSVIGLSCIDGEPAVEHETCDYREFTQKQWYRIRLRVTQAKVEAWIDKEKIIEVPTKDRKFTIWFEPETALPLGFATWETTCALRNISVRRLKPNQTTDGSEK